MGKDNIVMKEIVAGAKTELIETISAENFLKVLRQHSIMKRWEDLDENLQTFLGITPYYCEHLMIRKIHKCYQDFKRCKFFEYYGFEMRNEADIDSDDEPDDFDQIKNIKSRLTMIKKQNTIMKKATMTGSSPKKGMRMASNAMNQFGKL